MKQVRQTVSLLTRAETTAMPRTRSFGAAMTATINEGLEGLT